MKSFLTSIKDEIKFKNNVVILFIVDHIDGTIDSIGFDIETKELPAFIINETTNSLVDFIIEELYSTYSLKVKEDDVQYLCDLKINGFEDIEVFMIEGKDSLEKGRSKNEKHSKLIFSSVENKKFDFITEAILYNYLKRIHE